MACRGVERGHSRGRIGKDVVHQTTPAYTRGEVVAAVRQDRQRHVCRDPVCRRCGRECLDPALGPGPAVEALLPVDGAAGAGIGVRDVVIRPDRDGDGQPQEPGEDRGQARSPCRPAPVLRTQAIREWGLIGEGPPPGGTDRKTRDQLGVQHCETVGELGTAGVPGQVEPPGGPELFRPECFHQGEQCQVGAAATHQALVARPLRVFEQWRNDDASLSAGAFGKRRRLLFGAAADTVNGNQRPYVVARSVGQREPAVQATLSACLPFHQAETGRPGEPSLVARRTHRHGRIPSFSVVVSRTKGCRFSSGRRFRKRDCEAFTRPPPTARRSHGAPGPTPTRTGYQGPAGQDRRRARSGAAGPMLVMRPGSRPEGPPPQR